MLFFEERDIDKTNNEMHFDSQYNLLKNDSIQKLFLILNIFQIL